MEWLLLETSFYSEYFNILTIDLFCIETQNPLKISFNYLCTANVYYKLFGELLKGFSFSPQIFYTNRSVITIYFGKYGKLLKGSEDKSMVDIGKDNTLNNIDNKAVNSNSKHGEDEKNLVNTK